MIGDSKYETNFPQKLLLTDRQVAILHKAFAKNLLANIKLSKSRLSKTVQSGRFLGKHFALLLKIGLSLMKHVFQSLVKCGLIPLGLTGAASAVDTGFHKKKMLV